MVDLTLCSKRQIDVEDFVNFRGLLRKYELYEAALREHLNSDHLQICKDFNCS